MDLGFDVVVTITGIVLVFLILVLLMAIITLEGKIFDAMNASKKAAKAAAQAPAAKPAADPVRSAVMWWPLLWLLSMQWATASTPLRQCVVAKMAGARPA